MRNNFIFFSVIIAAVAKGKILPVSCQPMLGSHSIGPVQAYTLPNETTIRMLSPVYFLCTKLVALRDRGWENLRVSQDLEDIVHLVDNRVELPTELAQTSGGVRAYIRQRLRELLAHPAFAEALAWTVPYGADYTYQQVLQQRLRQLATGAA